MTPNIDLSSSGKSNRFLVVCSIILMVLLAAGGIIAQKPFEGHECYVTVTARQMVDSGDWVVPRFNGEVRLQKTPLNYWLVAAMGKITGSINEITARIPSELLALLLTAGIIYFAGNRIGIRCAAVCALVWITSLACFRYGQSARPEMSLTCFTAISMLSFYSGLNEKVRKKQIAFFAIFWISLSLAMLAKGPAPLPMVGVPLFVYFIYSRKWKMIGKILPIAGVLIFLAIIIPWPMALMSRLAEASGETNTLAFWKREFIDRFTGSHDAGSKPIYYYIPVMFQLMAPWVFFVPMALISPFHKIWGEKRKAMMFLWIWFVCDVIFMSISGGKRTHYILPAMPAMAILIGIIIEDIVFTKIAFTEMFASRVIKSHFLVLAAAAIAVLVYAAIKKPVALLAGPLIAASVLFCAMYFKRQRKDVALVLFFTAYSLILATGYCFFIAPESEWEISKQFASDVAGEIPANEPVISYGRVTPRFVHYFGKDAPLETKTSTVFEKYEKGYWVVATGKFADQLQTDSRFETVKQWKNAEVQKDEVIRGAIFHRSP